MVYYLVMIRLNIHEAKTHLSRYLGRLLKGEVIVLCKRNVPIAEIRAMPPPRTRKRPIGLAKAELTIPDSFFKPLPEETLEAFSGGGK